MMPSQLTNIKQSMKPKIGFSIESIVGGGGGGGIVRRSSDSFCEDSDDASNYISKSPKLPTSASNNNNNDYSAHIKRARCVSPSFLRNDNSIDYDRSHTRLSRESSVDQDHQNNNSDNNNSKNLKSRSPSPLSQQQLQQHASSLQKTPIIVRPMVPHPPHSSQLPAHYPDFSSTSPSHNPHFLAQFQAAAALANVHAAQQSFNGHLPQHLPPHLHHNPNLTRDSYPLYPWLLSRHGRIFPHRFPGTFPDFLLQPFRKPKRVRTAFSPTQLLKLEHAFEGNHYVVGAERKTLAQQLSLTETQVKVWFQNRRTKHKRMQQEDGDSKSGNQSNGSPRHEDEESECEIDVDEYPSDDDDCGDNGA